ncbi:MAG: hypothetical protein Kow006_06670 [Gammaproteobacteria bacterium]
MVINPLSYPVLGLKLPQFTVRGNQAPLAPFSSAEEGRSAVIESMNRMASLMESQARRSLGGMAAISPKAPATAGLSPQAVADRVLEFIGQALQKYRESSASDLELRNRLAAAREGVEHGFREARRKLQEEGRFHGEVAGNARETRKLIQKGIDELEGRLRNTEVAAEEVFRAAGRSRLSLRESVALRVETREGDVVTIMLRRSAASKEAYRIAGDRDGYSLDYQASNKYRAKLDVEVKGDLNADEQAALRELLGDVDDLAERFFAGNLDSALQEARQLSLDPEELAGFSLHLRQKATARVSAYQEVASLLPDSEDPAREALPPGVTQGLSETAGREEIHGALKNVKNLGASLFAQRLLIDERFDLLRAALDAAGNRMLEDILVLQPADVLTKEVASDPTSPEVVEKAA